MVRCRGASDQQMLGQPMMLSIVIIFLSIGGRTGQKSSPAM